MAKRVKVSRKELVKEPDQFLSATQKFSLYASQHRNNMLIGTGLVVVLLALVGGYRYNQQVKSMRMESLYFKMAKIHNQSSDKDSGDKTGELEKLLGQFSEGPQKVRASLLLAEEFFQRDQFDKAIALYEKILDRPETRDLSSQLARVGLAYSYEGKKDYKKAVEIYKSIVGKANGFPLFDIYVGLARCYELDSDPKNALLTLREVETRFQGHPQLDSVKRRIAKLSAEA